jgi:hypothetical protein
MPRVPAAPVSCYCVLQGRRCHIPKDSNVEHRHVVTDQHLMQSYDRPGDDTIALGLSYCADGFLRVYPPSYCFPLSWNHSPIETLDSSIEGGTPTGVTCRAFISCDGWPDFRTAFLLSHSKTINADKFLYL